MIILENKPDFRFHLMRSTKLAQTRSFLFPLTHFRLIHNNHNGTIKSLHAERVCNGHKSILLKALDEHGAGYGHIKGAADWKCRHRTREAANMQSYLGFILLISAVGAVEVATDKATTTTTSSPDLQRDKRQLVVILEVIPVVRTDSRF